MGSLAASSAPKASISTSQSFPPKSKAAFPRHYHYQNDELFVILEGRETLHYGDTDYPLKPMDVVSILAGTGLPFQIDNTGDNEMRYLAFQPWHRRMCFTIQTATNTGSWPMSHSFARSPRMGCRALPNGFMRT
ncbi:MAG: cupin domain-containing protein [Rhodobacteraceae bacterium]|nr:cupin domain-containing protein [Paracoccaceae bacterium]